MPDLPLFLGGQFKQSSHHHLHILLVHLSHHHTQGLGACGTNRSDNLECQYVDIQLITKINMYLLSSKGPLHASQPSHLMS